MRVYANPKHIEEAIQRCTLFNTKPISGGNWCISVKPRFCLSLAISHFGKDIGHLLTIFMRSFTWVRTEAFYTNRTSRRFCSDEDDKFAYVINNVFV